MSAPAQRGAALVSALRGAAARSLLAGLTVGLTALALYLRTMMPDVGFWDTAEFQAVGPVLGIAHPTGYPAYTLLAWLASVVLQPFGNEALRANMLSALLVAAGMGIVGATVALLTRRLVLGVAAGTALALGTQTWAVGLRADPHALHVFLVALLLLLLVVWAERSRAGRPADRWLVGAAVVFGMSLANHGLTFLLAPGVGLFVLLVEPGIVRRPRFVLGCAVALGLTTVALYAYLPLRSAMNPPLDYANPQTWEGFRYLVFAEQFRGEFQRLPDLLTALRQVIGVTYDQLGPLAVLALFGFGAAAVRRPALLVLLTVWLVISWTFALGYINADISRYYIVPVLCAAVLGGLGAGALWDGLDALARRLSGARPQTLVTPIMTALVALALIGPTLAALPERLERLDLSDDRLARQWLTDVMTRLPEDAVVISWWSYSTTLWYGLYVDRLRPDLTVIDDSTIVEQHLGDVESVIDGYLGRRPVFLIRLEFDLPRYEERYELTQLPDVPGGLIYRVVGRRSSGSIGAHL